MGEEEGQTNGGEEGSRSRRPFWQNPGQITAVAALVAAVIPITAAINGYATLRLEQQKQSDATRLQYLDRALRPGQEAADRKAILQFIAGTSDESFSIGSWAEEELGKIAEAEDAFAASREAVSNLESVKLGRAVKGEGGAAEAGHPRQAGLDQQYAALRQEEAAARKQLDAAASRAGVVFTKADRAPSVDRFVEEFRETFRGDLGFIQRMEGHEGRPYWWGEDSGVTLDPGLDLGRADRDTLLWAYGDSLTPLQLEAALKLIGVRGEEAKRAVKKSPIKGIRISKSEAARVLAIICRPIWNVLLKRFPDLGQPNTPGAVQTAVLSLAFSRGPSNRGLDELAEPIESSDWLGVADKIGAMQQDHRLQAIQRRRVREADVIRDAIAG